MRALPMVMTSETFQLFTVPWARSEMQVGIPQKMLQGKIEFTDLPALPDPAVAFRQAMDEPIGTPPLAEIVRPGAKVALLTGDRMTDLMLGSRDGLGHVILDYLNRAGVRDEDVTLVFAPGTHPIRNADEKLGPKLIGRVGRYVKHDALDDRALRFVGYTSHGNAIWLNRAVVEADVVIGVGEISPNTHGGWCGGGKMIVPGVAGRATVEHNHRQLIRADTPLGLADGNPLRRDMEEGADLGRLAFKLDVLVNSDQRIVGVFSGDFRKEHRAALPTAREIWMTRLEPVDIAVFSPGDQREYYLESSLFLSLDAALLATRPDGVIIFLASARGGYAPEGGGLSFNYRTTAREVLTWSSPEIARAMIDAEGNVRTGSILFAAKRVLEQRAVFLVSEGIDPAEARAFGFADGFGTFEEALARARALKGSAASLATCFPRGIQWRILPWREG
ncbi:MAG TPA: lactate racemase domain-containing protein [Chloroflexota bacterium]|nr:lactate racemase domain-containing protein [Chloroflexota bacterium]